MINQRSPGGKQVAKNFFFIMTVILEFTLRLEGIRFPATFVGALHKNKLRGKEQPFLQVPSHQILRYIFEIGLLMI